MPAAKTSTPETQNSIFELMVAASVLIGVVLTFLGLPGAVLTLLGVLVSALIEPDTVVPTVKGEPPDLTKKYRSDSIRKSPKQAIGSHWRTAKSEGLHFSAIVAVAIGVLVGIVPMRLLHTSGHAVVSPALLATANGFSALLVVLILVEIRRQWHGFPVPVHTVRSVASWSRERDVVGLVVLGGVGVAIGVFAGQALSAWEQVGLLALVANTVCLSVLAAVGSIWLWRRKEVMAEWRAFLAGREEWRQIWAQLKVDNPPEFIGRRTIVDGVVEDRFRMSLTFDLNKLLSLHQASLGLALASRGSYYVRGATNPETGENVPTEFTILTWRDDAIPQITDPSTDTDIIKLWCDVCITAFLRERGIPNAEISVDLRPLHDTEAENVEKSAYMIEPGPASSMDFSGFNAVGTSDALAASLRCPIIAAPHDAMHAVIGMDINDFDEFEFANQEDAVQVRRLVEVVRWESIWMTAFPDDINTPTLQPGLLKRDVEIQLTNGRTFRSNVATFVARKGVAVDKYYTNESYAKRIASSISNGRGNTAKYVVFLPYLSRDYASGQFSRHNSGFSLVWAYQDAVIPSITELPDDRANQSMVDSYIWAELCRVFLGLGWQTVPDLVRTTVVSTERPRDKSDKTGDGDDEIDPDIAEMAERDPRIRAMFARGRMSSRSRASQPPSPVIRRIDLVLYGTLRFETLVASQNMLSERLRVGWLRLRNADDHVELYVGPTREVMAKLYDQETMDFVAKLDWEDAWRVAKVVGSDASVPKLVEYHHLPTNEALVEYTFQLPRGFTFEKVKGHVNALKTTTGLAYITIEGEVNDANTIHVFASPTIPLPDRVPYEVQHAAQLAPRLFVGKNIRGEDVAISASEAPHILVSGTTGSGKAQPLTTRIPVPPSPRYPKGIALLGDLDVGDVVYARNGKPTKITRLTPVNDEQVYLVALSSGDRIECSSGHLWRVRRSGGNRPDDAKSRIAASGIHNITVTQQGHTSTPSDHTEEVAALLKEAMLVDSDSSKGQLAVLTTLQLCEALAQGERIVIEPHDPIVGSWSLDDYGLTVEQYVDILVSGRVGDLPPDHVSVLAHRQRREVFDLLISRVMRSFNVEQAVVLIDKKDFPLGAHAAFWIARAEGWLASQGNGFVAISTFRQPTQIVEVVATEQVVPMRCITVEDEEHCYLTTGFVPTHNSVTARALVYSALLSGDHVYVFDPVKLAPEFKPLSRFLHGYLEEQSRVVVAGYLSAIVEEAHRRIQINAKYGAEDGNSDLIPPEERYPMITVFVDEFTTLLNVDTKAANINPNDVTLTNEDIAAAADAKSTQVIIKAIAELLATARSVKIRVILATQRLTADTLNTVSGGGNSDMKTNLARILMGNASQNDRMVALRTPQETPAPPNDGKKGRAVFEPTTGSGLVFQSAFIAPEQAAADLQSVLAPVPSEERIDPMLYLPPEIASILAIKDEQTITFGEDRGVIEITEDEAAAEAAALQASHWLDSLDDSDTEPSALVTEVPAYAVPLEAHDTLTTQDAPSTELVEEQIEVDEPFDVDDLPPIAADTPSPSPSFLVASYERGDDEEFFADWAAVAQRIRPALPNEDDPTVESAAEPLATVGTYERNDPAPQVVEQVAAVPTFSVTTDDSPAVDDDANDFVAELPPLAEDVQPVVASGTPNGQRLDPFAIAILQRLLRSLEE